jgi:hypothetical protein
MDILYFTPLIKSFSIAMHCFLTYNPKTPINVICFKDKKTESAGHW